MFSASDSPDAFLACHRLALAQLPPQRLTSLLRHVEGDPVRALACRDGLSARQRSRLDDACAESLADDLIELAQRLGVSALPRTDPGYPPSLAPFDDAPAVLFVRGDLAATGSRAVAVVGSRRATGYGRAQAVRFARAFAEAGWCVVSGGAAGIDTAAHRGALDADGTTLAVVACGLDTVYPAENRALFQRIVAQRGAVVSEFPLGTLPEPWRFPTRNRIIAGLADATVVVEAPETSGALITARNCAEYGRDVYVVPGPIDNGRHRGGHRLIQDGALLADGPEDIVAPTSLPLLTSAPPTLPPLGPDEAALLAHLEVGIDSALETVAAVADLPAQRAAVAAILLETKGCVVRQPGGRLRRSVS